MTVGAEELFVEVGAGAEDLSDLAFDEFTGFGFFDLVTDSDTVPGFEEFADVGGGGVVWDAAHRGRAAAGQGDVEDLSPDFGVFVEHLIEVAEAEQEEGIWRKLAFDPPVLSHHWGQIL